MLVLSRKRDEGLIIEGPARLVVVSIKGDKVRLGVEGTAKVLREELVGVADRDREREPAAA